MVYELFSIRLSIKSYGTYRDKNIKFEIFLKIFKTKSYNTSLESLFKLDFVSLFKFQIYFKRLS